MVIAMKKITLIKNRKARFHGPLERPGGERMDKTAMPGNRKPERGFVLVVVLVLSAVVLAVMTAMIYMITSGTQISGGEKRYKTALEAAKGGSELVYHMLDVKLSGDPLSLQNANPVVATPSTCTGTDLYSGTTYTGFDAKLHTASTTWSPDCKANVITIDPSNPAYPPDVTMTLGQYTYYAKINGTVQGNSGTGNPLYNGSVSTAAGQKGGGIGSIPVVSQPYLFAIEVNTENASNPDERAKLSILYQY